MNAEILRGSGEKIRRVALVTSAGAAIFGFASEMRHRNKSPKKDKRKQVDYSQYSLNSGDASTIYKTPYDS